MEPDADRIGRRLREMAEGPPKWEGPTPPPQVFADVAEEMRDGLYLLRTDPPYRRYVALVLEAATPEEMNAAYETVYGPEMPPL